ncbi:hypothetical protein S58_09690 [Bradyrhizobium oligotrophicum S58]|uniref:LamG-like jellyroll fold domain-containing protein n=1 Tax=Bradyrhizobium oligotrophicum S58 TaxID=1245469 RepID=M4ZL56_9BRAD|nr:DUF1553 domain-containing protein [Bradyrhizobium oligotrophicum]BAM86980.1 hypothetical protein S58_09690 [Bradyrhizobium oligotrophicum S58]
MKALIGSGLVGVAASATVFGFRLQGGGWPAVYGEELPDVISYNTDVRPILSQNCFRCHGPDAAARKAGLRLDVPESAYAELPKHHGAYPIVPGKPRNSELLRRLAASDPDERMPPPDTHLSVSKREVALLERWVQQGARYERHWAFIPPSKSVLPRTPWDTRANNEIDRYVYGKLAQHNLVPSAEADKETLINRVAMDLTGLPPTLQEVDSFLADNDANAYEKVVERLLGSRAYAERQANIWLDVARYADSDGFTIDALGRFQYPYRDWVISAFDRNMPYDKFVTWQIAGDKLPNATPEQVLATAFARAGKKSAELGITDEEYRVEYASERTDLIGKAVLGLTVGCAKCHDHKYDEISQAEYYSLMGFFNSVDERGIADYAGWGPTLAWPSPQQSAQLAILHNEVERRFEEFKAIFAAAKASAESTAPREVGDTGELIQSLVTEAQQAYYPFENSYKASFEPLTIGKYPARIPNSPVFGVAPGQDHGGGRAAEELDAAAVKAANGNRPPEVMQKALLIGLDEQKLAYSADGVDPSAPGAINGAHVVDGPPGKGKAIMIDDTIAFANKKVGQFERTDPFTLDVWLKLRADKTYSEVPVLYNSDIRSGGYELRLDENVLSFNLRHTAPYDMIEVAMTSPLPTGQWTHVTATYDGSSSAAGVHLYVDGEKVRTEVLHDRLTRSILPNPRKGIYGWFMGLSFGRTFGAPEFNGGSIDELRVFTRALTPVEVSYLHDPSSVIGLPHETVQGQLSDALAERDVKVKIARANLREAVLAEQTEYTKVPQIDVLMDRPKERPTYLLERGSFDRRLQQVPVQALGRIFPWKSELPRNRLGLAEWLFDPQNPLTARVYVNRIWRDHFGTGIVETVEDYGTQGSNPSNPELLDYLATELVRSGWDIKHIHRLIVMSATYRQSSVMTAETSKKDPRNVYLARGPRYRLSAEAIRDNALAASGLLVDRVGGDSVFPYQPGGLWFMTGAANQVYPDRSLIPADELHRRSMYTFIKRNSPPPAMSVFDLADRNVSSVSRSLSNTPLQALVLLNDPQFVEAYRKLAERGIRSSSDGDQQIVTVFRLVTRRHPSNQELETLRKYRASQVEGLSASPQDAAAILSVGNPASDLGANPATLAAMTLVTAAIMNTPDAYSLR